MARSKHFIAIHPHKLLYGRVPKVANSSIKNILANTVTKVPVKGVIPTHDAYWTKATAGDTELVSSDEAHRLSGRYLSFTFVRDPLDRVLSCYASKFRRNTADIPRLMRQAGFYKDMSLSQFVDQLVAVDDDDILDVHLRPQAAMLCYAGRPVPEFIGRYEGLDEDWLRLAALVKERCGLELPKQLAKRNPTPDALKKEVRATMTTQHAEAIRRRYSEDYRLFYG